MDIVVRPGAEQADRLAAEVVADTVGANPKAVLGLATGHTMLAIYALLVQRYRAGELDFTGVTTFALDEYIGLGREDEKSFANYLHENFYKHVGLGGEQCHALDGLAEDEPAACAAYEARIAAAGGIDLQLLGIGLTGHIGFNEPGSALESRTRTKALSDVTRRQNTAAFGDFDRVPDRAMTMGIGTILDARRCLLLATGESKAEVVAAALEGPVSASMPASALQFHPNCTVILDGAAASKLRNTGYYLAAYAREPEWARYRDLGL